MTHPSNSEIVAELEALELLAEHVVEMLVDGQSEKRRRLYQKLRVIEANLSDARNEFEST